jgi:hypothetical protein
MMHEQIRQSSLRRAGLNQVEAERLLTLAHTDEQRTRIAELARGNHVARLDIDANTLRAQAKIEEVSRDLVQMADTLSARASEIEGET